jgi:hypothetical protein
MARSDKARRNISCSICRAEFFPSYEKWARWKKKEPTYCSYACVKTKHGMEAHARNPDRPCTTCGKMFKLSRSQCDKIKSRPNTGLYCSTECLYKSRETNPRKAWAAKLGEKHFTARICGNCNGEFVPSPRQRQWGALNPKARSFCSTECDRQWMSAWLTENRVNFRRPTYVLGPSSPQWKHGLYSSAARELYKLRTKIKRHIKEGAN